MASRTTYSAVNTSPASNSAAQGSLIATPPVSDEHLSAPNDHAGSWKSGLRDGMQRNAGVLLIGAAQAFFASVNVLVKQLNSIDPPVPVIELVLVRMGITWLFCVTYMSLAGIPHPVIGPKGVRLLLLVRGIFGFVSLFCMYYSLQYLSLSDATVLDFLIPLCTAAAGVFVLRERMTIGELGAAVFSLGGVVVIARPPFIFGDAAGSLEPDVTPAERMKGVSAGLIMVVGASGAYTTVTAIGKRAHVLHSAGSFSSMSVVGASISMLALRVHVVVPTSLIWLLFLALIGIGGFLAQVLLMMGLQREGAARGSLGIYFQIIFAVLLDIVVFGTFPPFLSWLGMGVIIASAAYVMATKKKRTSGPEAEPDLERRRLLNDDNDDEEEDTAKRTS